MDWTSIITALLTTGGLVAIVTMTEKKSAAILENARTLADAYKSLAEEYQSREAEARQNMMEREEYLNQQAHEKTEELMAQVRMNSSLRHSLDDAHTELAVCKIMYCKESTCPKRNPPFGSDAQLIVRKTKEQARKAYDSNHDEDGNNQQEL